MLGLMTAENPDMSVDHDSKMLITTDRQLRIKDIYDWNPSDDMNNIPLPLKVKGIYKSSHAKFDSRLGETLVLDCNPFFLMVLDGLQ